MADNHLSLVRGNLLALIAPAARGFDGGFHRLGARIHRQHDIEPGKVSQFFAEMRQLFVVKSPRRQRHLPRLFDEGGEQHRMRVALVQRRVSTQAIEIALAGRIVDPHALGAFDDYGQRVVVVGAKLLFDFEEFRSLGDFSIQTGDCIKPDAVQASGSPVRIRSKRRLISVNCALSPRPNSTVAVPL